MVGECFEKQNEILKFIFIEKIYSIYVYIQIEIYIIIETEMQVEMRKKTMDGLGIM